MARPRDTKIWTYLDETDVAHDGQHVSVLGALVVPERLLDPFHRRFYAIQRKYFGRAAARDGLREFKGKKLLGPNIEKKIAPRFLPKNWMTATEILHALRNETPSLKYFAALSYSTGQDLMVGSNLRQLTAPFQNLLSAIAEYTVSVYPSGTNHLVFDTRPRDACTIAPSIVNFVKGTQKSSIHPYPLFAESHSIPGVQACDILTYIVANRALKHRPRFIGLFREYLEPLLWKAGSQRSIHRFDKTTREVYVTRRKW